MQNVTQQPKEDEIDLLALFKRLWKRKWAILVSGVVCGVIAFLISSIFITPLYTASITLYANNSSTTDGNTSVSSSDLNASAQLVNTYAAIILSDPVIDQVIASQGLNISTSGLMKCVAVEAVNNTEVFRVTVEYTSPQMAANIANAIADIAPNKIGEVVEGCSVKIVSNAKVPETKSSPSNTKAAALGIVLGVVISAGIIIVFALLDTRIKNESDLQQWGLPVLGAIPAFEEAEKSGTYGYGYQRKGAK